MLVVIATRPSPQAFFLSNGAAITSGNSKTVHLIGATEIPCEIYFLPANDGAYRCDHLANLQLDGPHLQSRRQSPWTTDLSIRYW